MPRLIFLLGVVFCVPGCSYFDIDRCLDRGGNWDNATEECRYLDKASD